MDNTQTKRKPYVRPVEKGWWLKNSFYIHYMLREGTCLFVSIYAVILLVGLLRLSQSAEAWQGWLQAMTHPLAMLFHVLVLAACLFHAKTWFALAPKAMRVMIGEEPLPDRLIVLGQYAALGAVSVVVLLVALLA